MNYSGLILLPIVLLFFACQLQEPEVKSSPSDTGILDFSKYVAIGNSLTAGFQSGSLVEDHQKYSFPNLIARQLSIKDFQQPTVTYPGLPGLMTLESVTGTLGTAPGMGIPTNLGLARPYDNMGIPGILLADVDSALSSALSYSKSPAIDLILRGFGTQLQQALSLNPKFMTLWIGNNDALGFASSGGTSPSEPTNPILFDLWYRQLADKIANSGARVVVANIPGVTFAPYFTTVGPMVAAGVAGAKAQNPAIMGLYYQRHGEIIPDPASGFTNFDEAVPPLVTLVGGRYAGLLGQPTGKWYRDVADGSDIPVSDYLATLPGIDTTQAFGFHPHNPWPDALILDADELATVNAAIAAYNNTIASVALQYGFGLFDANKFLAEIAADSDGYNPGYGLPPVTTAYISGGLISLDGVHPTNLGYAIIANKFIEAANNKFGTNIQPVNLRDVVGRAPPAAAKISEYDLPALNYTIKILGGSIN